MIDPRGLMRKYFQAFLGRLVPGFIHNLNSPLQVLSFALEFVQQDLQEISESSKPFERLDTAKAQVKALSEMVKDLRALERIGTTDEPVIMQEMFGIFKRVLMHDLFCKHNVTLDVQVDPESGVFEVGGLVIIPAFCELIQNGLTALQGAEKKLMTLRARSDGKKKYLEVYDTGCGLPKGVEPCELLKAGVSMWPENVRKELDYLPMGMGLYCIQQLLKDRGCELELLSESGVTVARIICP